MPYDNDGTFSRVRNWQQDQQNGVKIIASRMDQEFDNYKGGLDLAFLRDGRVPLSGNLNFAGFAMFGASSISLTNSVDIEALTATSTRLKSDDPNSLISFIFGGIAFNIGTILGTNGVSTNGNFAAVNIGASGSLTVAGTGNVVGAFSVGGIFSGTSAVLTGTLSVTGNASFGAVSANIVNVTGGVGFGPNENVRFDVATQKYIFRVAGADVFSIGASGITANVAFSRNAGTVAGTVQDRLIREVFISDAPFGVPLDGSPCDAQLQAALDSLPLGGGGGWCVRVPNGRLGINTAIVVPNRVMIAGDAERSAIISLDSAQARFVFDGVELAGMRDLRIGLSAVAGIKAIDIKTTSVDARGLNFENLEIVGASIDDQVGIRAVASGGHIVNECLFRAIRFRNLDQPVIELDTEGNMFLGVFVDKFGFANPRAAFSCRSHASTYIFDVRGEPVAGSKAYAQQGATNFARLVADVKSIASAIDVSGDANTTVVSRPENLTPLGTFAANNTVIDDRITVAPRALTRTATPTPANFILNGFGAAASAVVTKGGDQSGRFFVQALGAGTTPNPTVEFYNSGGPYPFPPNVVMVTRAGGNQPNATVFNTNVNVGGFNFQMAGTPVSGETYVFDYLVG